MEGKGKRREGEEEGERELLLLPVLIVHMPVEV